MNMLIMLQEEENGDVFDVFFSSDNENDEG